MQPEKLCRLTFAAKKIRQGRTTLVNAIERGELTSYTTLCGLPLVSLEEVVKWSKAERKLGRPPKDDGQSKLF